MRNRTRVPWLGLFLILGPLTAIGEEPTPVPLLQVRGVRPEVLVDRLIQLFEGSRAPHPAAALSAWKNAGPDRPDLGKTLEAVIAALNPAMVPELEALDGARLRVVVEPENGEAHWCLVLPRDDGRFGGFARALALTDGALLDPLGGRPVLRVGPEGSPVALGPPGPLLLASDLDTLAKPFPPDVRDLETSPGWYARLDPSGLRVRPELRARQAGEALAALGVRGLSGGLRLEGETLAMDIASVLETSTPPNAVKPEWIDALPSEARGRIAVFALAWEPGEPSIQRAFAIADRVERTDSARAGVAPLRVRLNLLARAAKVNPETDLWPLLEGVSGLLKVDPRGLPDGGTLGLHARSPESAARIAGILLPRLARSYFQSDPVVEDQGSRRLGMLQGKPLRVSTRGASVWISWGVDPLPDAAGPPTPWLSKLLGTNGFRRFGVFWPAALAPSGTPFSKAMTDAPAVVWKGRSEGTQAIDTLRWEGLRGLIHRGLEALPLRTPSEPSGG